jgi:hypothetical protein
MCVVICQVTPCLVQCNKRISIVKAMKLVQDNRQDILDQFNQYNVHNVWIYVSYGGSCQSGIFSTACLIEP